MNAMPRFLALSDPLLGWTRPDVALTGVSGLVASQAASAFRGMSAGILPNGFDGAFWRAARARPQEDQIVKIVTALRLQGRKRPLALVEAFAAAAKRAASAGIDMRLTIAGDGPQRTVIERRIAALGLQDKITLAGWQSREALRDLYEGASLFVMPSRKEAFCIAALEARAAGLPVVAFAGTGIADFIRDGENGVLVQNDAALADALAALALDPGEMTRLAADTDGLDRYDWNVLADEHVALYARCMETGAKAKTAAGA
jgi:glycosyltransferase involved in cell wall biosynthesis